MNDIITILIIVGVIISFLNKIFRNQKKTETAETPPAVTRPKSEEWQPPWFEETEPEKEFLTFKENPVFETIAEVEEKTPVIVLKEFESKDELPVDDSVIEPQNPPELNISLDSPDDVKRGIVLAEILGQCKANKKLRRF
jgi:hypothetical protein